MNEQLSFIPLGGIGDVTKNMYLYEYKDQILIVDCGLGFADETMFGVDLLLPDISYLLKSTKKIVGMLLTHGHEDHIGALPFIIPQLTKDPKQPQPFPIYGTPLTAAFSNEKLKEFGVAARVQTAPFGNPPLRLGVFQISFGRVTHSVPDTSHIFIKTPVGNFYHGSDFKLDTSPYDGNATDYEKIKSAANDGVLCLFSDCLGAERPGRIPTESTLTRHIEEVMATAKGRCIVTTYSSNIARLNQVIQASENLSRHVCFLGRSLTKAKDVAQKLGYLRMKQGVEIQIDELQNYNPRQITLIVAGSQGQENSALTRIAFGEHKEIRLQPDDFVMFSADPIPGNEVLVYALIDEFAKKGIRVVYSGNDKTLHVSGHGAQEELAELITLTKPKKLLPIGGTFRHMAAYRDIAEKLGYDKKDVLLIEDGQEIIFTTDGARLGKNVNIRNVYVDEISGEEIEGVVLRDRKRLSESGIVIVLSEIDSNTGQIIGKPDFISRGLTDFDPRFVSKLLQDIQAVVSGHKGHVKNWVYMRKAIGEVVERRIFKQLRRRPLVLPVVIEV